MQIEVNTKYYPRLTRWHVRCALRWISPVDLVGVNTIRLLDESQEDRKAGEQPIYLKGGSYDADYVRENRHTAHIGLYTKNMYVTMPSLLKYTPVATLKVALSLSHEVGHHLIARRGYIYEPAERYKPHGKLDRKKEVMADSYAYAVIRKMSSNPYYMLGRLLARSFSYICYELGVIAYSKKNFKRAAYYFFCAYYNNREDAEAESAYYKAIESLTK